MNEKPFVERPSRVSGSYIMEQNGAQLVHIIFSMKESVGVLADALKIFKVITRSADQPLPTQPYHLFRQGLQCEPEQDRVSLFETIRE